MNEDSITAQEHVAPVEDILAWRHQLIRGVLRAIVVVGAVAVIVGSYDAYTRLNVWLIPVYLGIYAVLVVVTFWPRLSENVRAGIVLGLIYGLGVFDLVQYGWSGNGRIFLIGSTVMAAIFFGQRGGIFALLLTVPTLVGFIGVSPTGRPITAAETPVSFTTITLVSNTIVFLLVSTLLIVSQNYLTSRLTDALTRSRRLVQELETNQARLDERMRTLQEHEAELAQRTRQLQAMLDTGRLTSSLLAPDDLLHQAIDLICERFGCSFAGAFTLDAEGKQVELRAGRGEAGRRLVESRYRLDIGHRTAVGWAAAYRQLCIAHDTDAETKHMLTPLLPNARSEIALPLVAGNRLIGVLDAQSLQDNAFGQQAAAILQGMADELAAGLQNALRFEETQRTLGRAKVLYQASRRLTTATTTREVADAIIASVAETGADGCVVVQFDFSPAGDPEALLYLGTWRRDRAPLFQTGLRLPMSHSPFPFEMVSTLWIVADVQKDKSLPEKARQVFEATEVGALVNIPLRTKEKTIGQVVVLRTTPGPFSEVAFHLYEMLSDQAAVALERALLLEEAHRRAAREQLLSTIATRVRAGLTLEQVLYNTVREVGQTLGAARVAVRLKLPDDGNNRRQ